MNPRLLVDMNLTPEWVQCLASNGIESVHWSNIGSPTAPDTVIMAWARENGFVVFTHDMDFGTVLALTHESGPSVIQVRARSPMPEDMGPLVATVIRRHAKDLENGALVVLDEGKARVRILPL
jgi:predicted nuclease of predicted toxin-antitoxin system